MGAIPQYAQSMAMLWVASGVGRDEDVAQEQVVVGQGGAQHSQESGREPERNTVAASTRSSAITSTPLFQSGLSTECRFRQVRRCTSNARGGSCDCRRLKET